MYRVKLIRKLWFISVLSFLFTSLFSPAALAFDTWNPVTGPTGNPTGTLQWAGITSSSDGTQIAASSYEEVWLSSNSGVTWTRSTPNYANYRKIASSSDGSKLLLASSNSSQLQRSTDTGTSWTILGGSVQQSWHQVASSANGQVLAAAGLHGTPLYFSTNSGTSWTSTGVNANWNGIAISDNGATIVAVAGSRAIYVSTDSGVTWNNRDSARNWSDVSISNDGTKMVAAVNEGQIYKSVDSGTTWTLLANSPSRKYIPIACSSDCSTILAGTNWEGVYYSSDSGQSWYSSLPFPVPGGAPATAQIGWVNDVAISDDGSKAFAAPYGQRLYLSAKAAPPAPTIGAVSATGPTTASVSFTAPTTNGGSAITSYTATSNPGGITGSILQSGSGTINVTGLTPSTSYTFTVKATNSISTSSASSASASTTTNVGAPAFTISSASESKTVNTAITGYTISSTDGAIASYAISPAAAAGLTFNTTTGLLSGTPTAVAPATAYTITATNATSSTTQTFTLTVTAVPVVATNSAAEVAAQAAAARDAAARAASEAAAARREAEKKSARSEISDKFRSSEKVTIETFAQAEIAGITKENIEAASAEILALPEESRSDILQVLKIAFKYEVVGKIASDLVGTVPPSAIVQIGLIPEESRNKVALTVAIRKLPESERLHYTAIKAVIDSEMTKIQARKDRLAAVIARNAARNAA